MRCRWAKGLMLAAALSGLCPATQANTTAAQAGAAMPRAIMTIAQASPAIPFPGLTQNDLALPPVDSKGRAPLRIGLLLPLRSATLGAAAEAVRAGVQAAFDREDQEIAISIIPTDGSAKAALAGYVAATESCDIVLGPLARSEVAAIAQSGMVSKPSIALAQPEASGETDMALPPQMLAIGLSIEEEARQVANWVANGNPAGKALVVATNAAWQRRAAKAFAARWHELGLESQTMELSLIDGFLAPASLLQLKKRMQTDNPALLFVALDAGQTVQLRLGVGTEIAVYGTSQLNPLTLSEWQSAERVDDLNGTHLLDMPWQLQPDHPAVMIYPRPADATGQARGADMARLYAMGIDAYRVAREIALNNRIFQLDGVTGKLRVNFSADGARFERIQQPAIYQDGVIVPLTSAQ